MRRIAQRVRLKPNPANISSVSARADRSAIDKELRLIGGKRVGDRKSLSPIGATIGPSQHVSESKRIWVRISCACAHLHSGSCEITQQAKADAQIVIIKVIHARPLRRRR